MEKPTACLVLREVKDGCQTYLDGLLLNVIFKGVHQLRIKLPRRMQVSVHKKAWMDKVGFFSFSFIIFGVFNSGHDNFFERFVVKFASFRGSEVRNLIHCF